MKLDIFRKARIVKKIKSISLQAKTETQVIGTPRTTEAQTVIEMGKDFVTRKASLPER